MSRGCSAPRWPTGSRASFMIVIEIAGGVILAVLILAFLPWVLVGLSFAICAAVLLPIIGGLVIVSINQPFEAMVFGGVFLAFFVPWLIFEKKLRREIKAEKAEQAAQWRSWHDRGEGPT
jgi:hypothetical protein